MNINFSRAIICSIVSVFLFGCQPLETPPASTTPLVEVQVLEPMTETPVPACVILPDVDLSVELLSEDSIHIRITGLLPNETVQAIFGSKTKDRAVETVVSGSADEKGAFEYSERLRALESDREFKDWQIRVVHSRGSTCAEISLPEKQSGVSALAIQKYAQGGKVITRQKSGFDISAANFRYENEEIKVDVCFQLPSTADWRVWDATLQTKSGNLLLSTIAPRELTETLADGKRRVTTYGNGISWNDIPHDGQPDYLCETLAFFSPASEIDLQEIDLTQVSLVIQSIGALPREGQECAFYLETVQSRLDAKGIGIKLDCVSQEGGAQVVIARKPANMTQSEAETLVSKESVEAFIVQGPWIFPSSSQ